MVKRKKKRKDTLSSVALTGITSIIVVRQVSRAGGGATATGLSGNFATGVGNIGSTFPTVGRLKGTGFVLKGVKKLKKGAKGLLDSSF